MSLSADEWCSVASRIRRDGGAKRPAEPLPLRAANAAARQGRLALPGARTKIKAFHARHNGHSIAPPPYVGGYASSASFGGPRRRSWFPKKGGHPVQPGPESKPVKPSQSGSKWVKVISTIIFLQLQDPKPARSDSIRLNPTAAEDEAMGKVIAVNMAGPKRPRRGTRDHSISPPPYHVLRGKRRRLRVGRLASGAGRSRNRTSEVRVEDR